MENIAQIASGDVVRILPEFEDEDEQGKHYTVSEISDLSAEIKWGNRICKYRKRVPLIILEKVEEKI